MRQTKGKNRKTKTWIPLPAKSKEEWFSQLLVSLIALRAWEVLKKQPQKIHVPTQCLKDNPDGSATLSFEAQ